MTDDAEQAAETNTAGTNMDAGGTAAETSPEIADITDDDLVELVGTASEDDIRTFVRDAGTRPVLDRIFAEMEERFAPERAGNTDAVVQFAITDAGATHPYVCRIVDGTSCTVERGEVEERRTRIETDLVSFLRLITGHAGGPTLFMAGKLKVGGDLMFAPRIMNFFERPGS